MTKLDDEIKKQGIVLPCTAFVLDPATGSSSKPGYCIIHINEQQESHVVSSGVLEGRKSEPLHIRLGLFLKQIEHLVLETGCTIVAIEDLPPTMGGKLKGGGAFANKGTASLQKSMVPAEIAAANTNCKLLYIHSGSWKSYARKQIDGDWDIDYKTDRNDAVAMAFYLASRITKKAVWDGGELE